MPIGVVTDDDFEKEIRNSGVPIVGEVVKAPTKGRQENSTEVPQSIRKIIGETNEIEGRQSALQFAESLGLSPSSVSAYANGATSTSTYQKPNQDLQAHITSRKQKVSASAMTRLTRAMSALTKDKIATSSAKEISSIAKDMAQVVKMMEPDTPEGQGEGVKTPQFVVYAPTFVDERKFDIIQAKE